MDAYIYYSEYIYIYLRTCIFEAVKIHGVDDRNSSNTNDRPMI